ncbi:unnamed protein product [Trifolium pratense]|uniref:Uncharacterized protein n=1 Tax=Trifolium pratense TaxID=57577 RepID=A0ACB0IZI5_TRIPR|nr:unnamed protein product [Trifolium pratense]
MILIISSSSAIFKMVSERYPRDEDDCASAYDSESCEEDESAVVEILSNFPQDPESSTSQGSILFGSFASPIIPVSIPSIASDFDGFSIKIGEITCFLGYSCCSDVDFTITASEEDEKPKNLETEFVSYEVSMTLLNQSCVKAFSSPIKIKRQHDGNVRFSQDQDQDSKKGEPFSDLLLCSSESIIFVSHHHALGITVFDPGGFILVIYRSNIMLAVKSCTHIVMEDIDVIGVEDAFLINGSNMKVDDKLSGCVSNKENDGEPIFKELTLQVVMEEITSLKHLLYEVLNKQDCHFKETADEIVGLKTSCDSIQASIETLENIVKLKVNGPSSNDDKSQFVDPYLLNAQQRFNEDLSQIVYEHDFTEKDPMDEEVADVVASKINSSTLVYKPPSLPERWLKANTTCNTKKSAKQTALITKSDLKKNSHFKLEVKFACKPTYDMILAKRQPQVCAYLFQKTSDAKLMAEILVVARKS